MHVRNLDLTMDKDYEDLLELFNLDVEALEAATDSNAMGPRLIQEYQDQVRIMTGEDKTKDSVFIEECNKAFGSRSKALGLALEHIQESEQQFQRLRKSLMDRDDRLLLKEDALADLSKRLATFEESIQDRDARLLSKDDSLCNLRTRLAALDESVEDQNYQLHSKDAALADLRRRLAALDESVEDRDAHLHHQAHEIDQYQPGLYFTSPGVHRGSQPRNGGCPGPIAFNIHGLE